MRLARRSWPLAAEHAHPELDLGLIDEHVVSLDREMARLREAGKQAGDLRLRGGPAEDPRTCGHLLALADQVRSNPDALAELVASVAGDSIWFRELQQFLQHCSPRVRTAAGAHLTANLPAPRPAAPTSVPRRRKRTRAPRPLAGGGLRGTVVARPASAAARAAPDPPAPA
ncbi:hypothetical protein VA596_46975 [Amycolatopsis sp., V23-08]|uniref:Uncharacterized protein n=1 Tax=Amycolatopsis heterodermiae TaxID=3110235 RepID=A0ABU5RLH7_9PSEU|nr:hypothetical protein [Amycolatopsis sp., V23-08]MEA5367142.1 hypothetical protein [Amycolatopsis sp., V23-08]